MAEENLIQTNIVANANFAPLIADLNKVTLALSGLQEKLNASNKMLANNVNVMNKAFAETLRSTGQFSTHFVSLTSDIDKFGSQLDKGQIKLGQFFNVYKNHINTSGGIIRDLAKQQTQLQNAILQPLGRNAEGLMQYNVHIPRGLDLVKNKTAIAKQELQIMNKVIQEGAGQLINWGKNTQWAGRQLTVGLTVPMAAFGKAAADAFRTADEQLVRLTKVYGGLSATSASELQKVRKDVAATAATLSKQYGSSFQETLGLAADIAATGKQGNELLGSIQETTRLAVLGEVDRQDAMKATLAIQTAFKQNTVELSDSINFLNAVENQTSTTLSDLVEAIPKAGPVIKGMGGSIKDLALYLTAMREGGISASEGANALKSGLASLINPTKVATNMFAGFGIDLKSIVTKNAGDLTQTILDLQSALDTLNPLQKQQALEQLFGKFQFARMNALFSNLGKQGSQTLQVLDLMKASSQDLANIAGRELSQVTESASGKYRRALEGLKADLASVGDQFLTINTYLIKFIDGVIKVTQSLPDPIKKALGFMGLLTAGLGPLVMMTGVLGNFFGYVIKGISHFRSFFKGAEGWKLLTPEILAANKAGTLAEQTFYSDAKAASILNQSLQGLIGSYRTLQQQIESGVISTTMVPQTGVAGLMRQVNTASPYLSPKDTRSMSHLNPVAGMTLEQKNTQTMFGVVPGAPIVNAKIGKTPQMYMESDLPRIQGVSAVGKVSTGVVAQEAAQWHAMTAALGMQSKAEITKLKQEILRTGTVTSEVSMAYETLLPKMNEITQKAAQTSALIVEDLRANKINAQQASAKIVALNAEIEQLMVQASQQVAKDLGRDINVTQVPLLNQPVVDPKTGKSNMKELLKKGRTRDLLNKIARGLGVKTYGASYSIETTMPKRLNSGGYIYTANDGSMVPGPNVNADVVPAMLTPGEFVVNAESTRKNLPLLQAINGSGSNGPGYNYGSSKEIRADYSGRELAHLTEMLYTKDLSVDKRARIMKAFGVNFEQVSSPTARIGSSLFAGYHGFFNQGTNNGNLPISKAIEYLQGKPVLDPKLNAMVTHDPLLAYRPMLMDLGVPSNEMANFAKNMDKQIIAGLQMAEKNGAMFISDTPSGPNQISTANIGNSVKDYVSGFKNPNMSRNLKRLMMPGEFRVQRPGKSSSARYFPKTTDRVSTMISAVIAKKRMPQKLPELLNIFPKLGKTFDDSAIREEMRAVAMRRGLFGRNRGGIIGMNRGGKVPGYARGGLIGSMLLSTAGYAGGSALGGMLGGTPGSFIGGMLGGSLGGGMGSMGGGYDLRNSYNKSIFNQTEFGLHLARNTMQGGRFTSMLSKMALGLTRTNLALAGVTTVGLIAYKMWQSHQEQLDRVHKSYGLTAESASKLGLKFKDYNSEIKKSVDNFKALQERGKLAYESLASSGTPLNITIEQYKKLKEEVKSTMSEQINMINKTKSSDLGQLATQLKQQFVNAGMSAQEASKKIYAAFQLSNKASYAGTATFNNQQFSSITNAKTSAVSSIQTFGLASKKNDSVSQANALNNALAGVDAALQEITKESKKPLSEFEAQNKLQELIGSKIKNQTTLTQGLIDQLAKTNPEIRKFANTQDTVISLWKKMRLEANGFSGDLSKISAAQADALYSLQNTYTQAFANQNINGVLKSQYVLLNQLKAQMDKLTKAAKGQSAQQQQNAQDRIKQLQNEIDLINKAADAKKKALQEETQDQDILIQIQKAKLDYQEKLSAGDMPGAAQAQLEVQRLLNQQQSTFTERAIEDKRARDIAPKQAEIEKLQNAQNALIAATSAAAQSLTTITGKYDALKSKIDDINTAMANYKLALEGQGNLKDAATQLIAAAKVLGMNVPGAGNTTSPSVVGGKLVPGSPISAQDMASTLFKSLGGSNLELTVQAKSVVLNAEKILEKGQSISNPVNAGTTTSKLSVSQIKWGDKWMPGSHRQQVKEFAAKQGYGEGTYFSLTNKDGSKMIFKVIDSEGNIQLEKTVKAAGGGIISGAGTGTSDSIPAMLSNGEFVVNAKSAASFGYTNLNKINRMAAGGAVFNIPQPSISGRTAFGTGEGSFSSNDVYNVTMNFAETPSNAIELFNQFKSMLAIEGRNREAMNGRSRSL